MYQQTWKSGDKLSNTFSFIFSQCDVEMLLEVKVEIKILHDMV